MVYGRLSLLAALGIMAGLAPALGEEDARLAQGEALYDAHCAACHGEELEGAPDWRQYNEDGTLPPPPHDETGHTWHHPDKVLFDYTKLGGEGLMAGMKGFKSGMPAFEDELEDEEIWMILDFIKSTWPDDIRKAQEKMNKAAQAMEGE